MGEARQLTWGFGKQVPTSADRIKFQVGRAGNKGVAVTTASESAAGAGGAVAAPSALISWAHKNIGWTGDETAQWQRDVESFAALLRTHGVETDLDLWHAHESTIDWTRWGQNKVRDSNFVIVAISEAWSQRWLGTNAPTVGAGAVAEADALKGIFGRNQAEFQRKTMLALLPGVSSDLVPEDLYRLTRFTISELSRSGIDDLLRTLFKAPRHSPPPVGSAPTFGELTMTPPARPDPPFGAVTREDYLSRASAVSAERSVQRRRGAGLAELQIRRSLSLETELPQALHDMPPGSIRVLYGPLGSGKSEIAEQWLRFGIRSAQASAEAAVPIWIAIDDLDTSLEPHVVAEVGLSTLAQFGVSIVVDGLDERTNVAAALTRQAGEFVKKWPSSRILLTTRSREFFDESVVVTAPQLSAAYASRLMEAVAGHPVRDIGPQMEAAVTRPLFALLAAQHMTATDGATGVPEIIERVVHDVVSRENYNLFAEMRLLAMETIRAAAPVDPASFTSADVAAKIRASPFVTTLGRKCTFTLATFEQWFAAQAVLDELVEVDEVLATMESFNRWRYVLAIIVATAAPRRADKVMSAIARWNPGAASWVVNETGAGGLTRARPDVGSDDWEAVGRRVREATAAWLAGLGPLAQCFEPIRSFGCASIDDLAVAIEINGQRMEVAWLPRYQITGHPLPAVVQPNVLDQGHPGRSYLIRHFAFPTAVNGVWQTTRDHLADDLKDSFVTRALQISRRQFGVASEETRVLRAANEARRNVAPGFSGNLDIERLYPAADIEPSQTNPFGGFSVDGMHRYTVEVLEAAMRCYLELVAWVTPNFGHTLALRGLMPVEFFGTMFYNPGRERGSYEFMGPREPGFAWLMRPIGAKPGDDFNTDNNQIALTVNDDARADELTHDKTALYQSFRDYVEANPVYEPFSGPFTIHHGRLDIFHRTPATLLAVRWLWNDLKSLGFLTGSAPRDV